RAFALRVDAEDLAFVAGPDEQRAVGGRHHRPEKRRGRLVHQLGDGTQRELTVAVDREVLDVAFEEIGLAHGLEELRRRCLKRHQRQDKSRRRRQDPQPCSQHIDDSERSAQFGETVIVSVRDPATECSVGNSHWAIVALWSGLKLPPFRSPSNTPSTDGGSDDSSSPFTTAPAYEPSSFHYSGVVRRALLSALIA